MHHREPPGSMTRSALQPILRYIVKGDDNKGIYNIKYENINECQPLTDGMTRVAI